MKQQTVYVDYAAATPLDPAVARAMQPYWQAQFANPSSIHPAGVKSRQAVEQSRQTVARFLGAKPNEIIFVSGGTESANLAIKGVAESFARPGHIIVSQIEHHSVLDPVHDLERQGWEVTYLTVDRGCLIDPDEVAAAIRPNTRLISIGYVNNEIGVIQPIEVIGRLARKHRVLFHTDACQAGLLPLEVTKLSVDLLTLNAAKLYGPKGAGILYRRSGIRLQPQQLGGGQEQGVRSGTENVPAIVGIAAAIERVPALRIRVLKQLEKLEKMLLAGLKRVTPKLALNGHPTKRLPGLLNLRVPGYDADRLLEQLAAHGVYAGKGAACLASREDDSHVLTALRLTPAQRRSSIRLSLGWTTREKEIKQLIAAWRAIMKKS